MSKTMNGGPCPACGKKNWKRVVKTNKTYKVCKVCGHVEE